MMYDAPSAHDGEPTWGNKAGKWATSALGTGYCKSYQHLNAGAYPARINASADPLQVKNAYIRVRAIDSCSDPRC